MRINIPSAKCYSLAIAISLFAAAGCGGGGSSDQEIQDKLAATLGANAAYKNVTVAVKDGVVTLGGSCEGDHCAADVEAQAKAIKGVEKVENNMADDKTNLTLRTSVQAVVSKYAGVQADVAAGVVVLRGIIAREQLQPLMNELQALKPVKIDNQLAVKQ